MGSAAIPSTSAVVTVAAPVSLLEQAGSLKLNLGQASVSQLVQLIGKCEVSLEHLRQQEQNNSSASPDGRRKTRAANRSRSEEKRESNAGKTNDDNLRIMKGLEESPVLRFKAMEFNCVFCRKKFQDSLMFEIHVKVHKQEDQPQPDREQSYIHKLHF